MDNFTLIQFQYESRGVPLGALYLASGLEKENLKFDLKIYPFYKNGYDLDKLYSFLSDSSDIVAIGCWSDLLPYVIGALDKLKKRFPKKIIILGGVGPTEVAEEIIAKFNFVNFIIKGCGVGVLPKLIKRIQAGSHRLNDIDGLVYKQNNHIVSNYYKGFYLNIPDTPAYQRIDNIWRYNNFPIFTSFGCPYLCTFCDSRPVSPKKVIYRDLNSVVEEIKLIFVINKKRVFEFCKLLRSQMPNITWDCYGRVGLIDEELLSTMSKSGCKSIYYGVESGSNVILKKIKKGFTIEEAIKTLFLSKKYIKSVVASFIYLFPFETPADFYHTKILSYYLKSKGIYTQLHALTPANQSEVYFNYKKDLFLSKKINSSCRSTLNAMPKACIKLIRKYPDIFYYYYNYNSGYLPKIIKMVKSP
ncbi:MAG: radical SAM protein [Candidatus Omnitrophica bacterium]|nr:radical SAM protein [Candidatus Omnitrophota bacterium]